MMLDDNTLKAITPRFTSLTKTFHLSNIFCVFTIDSDCTIPACPGQCGHMVASVGFVLL